MKVSELIEQLQKLENKDATVHIVVGGDDDDKYDTTNIEVWSDHTDDGYQDIFAHVNPDIDFVGEEA